MPGEVHGGGCCLHVHRKTHMNTPPALIGVAHAKNNVYMYVQRLFAFRPEDPFDILAVSRPFCWRGRARSASALLRLENTTYPCPYIQMTMSISAKLGDPDTVLFAVGMNDCEARIVSMPLDDVLGFVFETSTAVQARQESWR